MSATEVPDGLLEIEEEDERRAIIELLTRAYWMEIETVTNYIAASVSHDGGRGLAVRAALTTGVEEEVRLARSLGRRIQELQHGVVPGAEPFASDEQYPQPPRRSTDVARTIEAVVATETSAIRHYQRIMRATATLDADTNALALGILRDEQRHLRLFEAFLREYVESVGADSMA
jgi:bacterioferritin